MLSRDMRALYKRLSVLALLCASLLVFGTRLVTENALARICIEVCYDRQSSCYDACPTDCSIDDPTCSNCIAACDSHFYTCVSGSTYCNTGSSYSPHCQVDWTLHCPIVSGVADCDDPGTHYGHSLTCDYGPSGSLCVACPDHETCTGSNGLPPCL